MLDSQTKKRIDDCRDILVGKITDPKSQVEQITIALIYKFMDDMDRESEDWGGVRSFFVGEYEQYSWSKIFSPRVDAHEMLNLYAEGIDKMSENPNIQPLFRSIFKDAYLPYRDPETLKLFLKTIDGFTYDHSERLGDAFEYLLSVLGSQGDAGQFRTPRHIIDFIVDVVEPQKGDRILDPACGTSGFLISSYKQILQENTKERLGDKLSSTEKKELLNNIHGYDISPDMVRLSLVNLFLHGFTEDSLNIHEYDTLTSEDRWNEYFDVILANPPFMTPKGGIRPHNRFSVKSNRAEVLFVNYIMEHLTPKGRAGIVVPEGIIFQSGTAYKELRKSLIEKYLVGVISLPSGVFNPYSGVKTSILLLDRELSKKTDKVFFGKVENDGYDLGAQRREIDKNDLPKIKEGVLEYYTNLRNGKIEEHPDLTYVSKEEILNSSDVGLSYERYNYDVSVSQKWEMVELGEVCDFQGGSQPPKDDFIYEKREGYIRFIQIRDFGERGKETYIPVSKKNKICYKDDVLIGRYGASVGNICRGLEGAYNVALIKCINDKQHLLTDYLFYILNNQYIQNIILSNSDRAAQAGLNPQLLRETKIPLPPLEIQKEIVEELEQYQKVIDGAKQVVENYKPHIEIDEGWEKVELSNITEVITKGSTPTTYGYKFEDKGINFIKIESLNEDGLILQNKLSFVSQECHSKFKRSQLNENDILFSIAGTKMGIIGYVEKHNLPANTNQALCIIRLKDPRKSKFLFYYLKSNIIQEHLEKVKVGVAQSNISLKQIGELEIPLLNDIEEHLIVEKLEEERKIVEGNKKLIELYTQKIEDRINKIWGD